ncbi:MAG: hypothetical protein Q7J57_14770 [Gemmobacter sp.]|nr:hypothetical protein [Gemmobacter sp.]
MTVQPDNSVILQAIGRIDGRLDGIFQRLDQSDEDRKILHARVSDTKDGIVALRSEVSSFQHADVVAHNDLAGRIVTLEQKIEPVIKTADDWQKTKSKVGWTLGGMGLAAFGAGASLWSQLTKIFTSGS